MSLNDTVKVLWKTNCKWRNRTHWPKRKDIKLRDGETQVDYLPLKLGDMVRIKFGKRWYDAEIAENWKPKTRKGKKLQVPLIKEVYSVKRNDEQRESDGNARALLQDSNEQFLAEQQEKEVQWGSQRAAKKRKTDQQYPEKITDIDDLQKKLDAKIEECDRLTRKLMEAENAIAEKRNNINTQEDIHKIMTRMTETLEVLEGKIETAFSKIDKRLESLESQKGSYGQKRGTVNFVTTPKAVQAEETVFPSISSLVATIDIDDFRDVCTETDVEEVTLQPTASLTSTSPSLVAPTDAEIQVREALINTLVTPRKAREINETLKKFQDIQKCAIKLLPFFFTKEEMSTSNTNGNFEKNRLDPAKLNSLKLLLFSNFPVTCSVDKEKLWRSIKSKINAKCRASKFASKFAKKREVLEPKK